MSTNGDCGHLKMDSELERPRWMTDELIEKTIRHFRSKTSDPFSETEAVQVLLSLSQLLDATGLLKLEIENETEEVHGMGQSEQP